MKQNDEDPRLQLKVIQTLCNTLQHDPLPLARVIAADTLGIMQVKTPQVIETLCKAVADDPASIVRITATLALQKLYGNPETSVSLNDILNWMAERPPIQMNFNAPVTGVAGNVEGNLINNPDAVQPPTDVAQTSETQDQPEIE